MQLKWKKNLAKGLSMAMITSSLSGIVNPSILVKAEANAVTYTFGTNGNVTNTTTYDAVKGYGFTDISYPNDASGWISNIYNPRVKVEAPGATNVINEADYLTIGSKVWTETGEPLGTDAASKGVFTYDNTSVFNVDLASANYDVTVNLVNPTSSDIKVNLIAEDLKKSTVTVPAQSTSTVSTYLISLIDGQLNLKFEADSSATTLATAIAQNAYVKSVSLTKKASETAGSKPTVYIASDSTVQTYDSGTYPQAGWGQTLYKYFAGADSMIESATTAGYSQSRKYELPTSIIENRALGGRSSKSFIDEGKLDNILSSIKPGDYFFVQWGHNDATYTRPNRYVSSADFHIYIQKYIDGAKQRGATPVLVTPVPRYSFTNGVANISFGDYRQVMLDMAAAQNIPVLDLGKAGADFLTSFGEAQSKSIFMQLDPGVYPNYPGGATDATHYQQYGAIKMSQLLAKLIKQNSLLTSLSSLVPDIPVPDNVPTAPNNLTTLTIGSANVKFKWDSVSGADLYYIYRAVLAEGQTAADGTYTQIGTSVTGQYTDSTCQAGITYAYKVAAYNEKGESTQSEPITATTKSSQYKYDFTGSGTGTKNAVGPTLSGWLQVKDNQLYTPEAGYGFTIAPGNARSLSPTDTLDAMMCDFTLGAGTFVVDLPNGDYSLKVYSGYALTGTSGTSTTFTAEGKVLGTVKSPKAGIGTGVYTTRVLDGQLTLDIGTNGYFNGLEITPLALAPTGLNAYEIDLTKSRAYGYFSLRFNGSDDALTYKIYRKGALDTAYSLLDSFDKAKLDDLHSYSERLGDTYQYYVVGVLADGTETAPSNTITIDMPSPLDKTALNAAITRAMGFKETDYTAASWAVMQTALSNARNFSPDVEQSVVDNLAVELNNAIDSLVRDIVLGQRLPLETLSDRALVAVSGATNGVYLSWRLFKEDSSTISFDVYRNGAKVKEGLKVTNWIDAAGNAGDEYYVIASSGVGSDASKPDKVKAWGNQYKEFQLVKPEDEVMPDGTTCTYTANDMSVGDLNGDGDYELIVKWYPSNAKDNSGYGYTGKTFLDAYDYDRNGNISLMWRIDLGVNIRSGAHYTQFQVADINGDGKAEVAFKTADGTTTYSYNNATGQFTETGYVGACSSAALPTNVISAANDYRNSNGFILSGPEYLTVFNGETGMIMDTVNYDPPRGDVGSWGDTYGNRVDRFLAGTAYLDGIHPSFIFARGYYSKTYLAAYTMIDGKLTEQWLFSSEDPTDIGSYTSSQVQAQGNHNLMIADVDKDGKDETIYGSICIDNDGKLKWNTGYGHGDAEHLIPQADGSYYVFAVHEHTDAPHAYELHDANTGEIVWGSALTGVDCGRGLSADIDPTATSEEMWANRAWNGKDGGVFSSQSTLANSIKLSDNTPSVNFSIYWDGDLLSEMFNHTFNEAQYVPVSANVTKWDYENNREITLFESPEVFTSNGTKGNPGLTADIMGDWREEMVLRSSADNSKIRMYTTNIPTDYSVPTLMQDTTYRLSIAWQNTGYNQPTDLGYDLTQGLITAQVSTTETTRNSVSIKWTPASDGLYGHPVQGYYIYRAGQDGNYTLLDTLNLDGSVNSTGSKDYSGIDAENNYYYKDNTVKASTTYSYKVAAIVDGKSSFNSKSVTTTTLFGIVSVKPLESVEIIEDSAVFELPAKIAAIGSDGTEVMADVTWDTSTMDITTPGNYKVNGTVLGYDGKAELAVTVKANYITGFKAMEAVSTIETVNPVLPAKVSLVYTNKTEQEVNVTWDTTGLDIAKPGTYTISGTVQEYTEKVSLTVEVKANYIASIKPVAEVKVAEGKTAELPTTVIAVYANNTEAPVTVTWTAVDTSRHGTYSIEGTVEGYEPKVTVSVVVYDELLFKFDFGGASTKYGAGKVEPGYTEVDSVLKYSAGKGYGFTDAYTPACINRDSASTNKMFTDYASTWNSTAAEFIVDLANGTYKVKVFSGDLGGSTNTTFTIEGTAYSKISSRNAVNSAEYTVVVTDGVLNVKYGYASGMGALNGLEITSVPVDNITDTTIRVVKGTNVTLPTTVKAKYHDDSVKDLNVTWTNANIVDNNTTGLYLVEGTVAETNIIAKAYVFVADIVQPSTAEFVVTMPINLPQTVTAVYGDNRIEVPVTWTGLEVLSQVGTYTIKGTVADYNTTVDLQVNIKADYIVGIKQVQSVEIIERTSATLPTTVTAIYATGKEEVLGVTWNTSELDTNTPGTYTLEGTVADTDVKACITVNVKAASITGIKPVNTVEVIEGLQATLPQVVTAVYNNGTEKEIAVAWGTVDTKVPGGYTIEGTVEGYTGKITVNLVVKAASITEVKASEAVTAEQGSIAVLPNTVTAVYNNGENRQVSVVWNTVDTSVIGEVTVQGTVAGYNLGTSIKVSVVRATNINTTNGDQLVIIVNDTTNKEICVKVNEEEPVVEGTIFTAIQGQDRTITFEDKAEDGTVLTSWTFDGELMNKTVESIDLTIKFTSPVQEDIKKVSENGMIISFAHHGDLPGTTTIKVKVDPTWLEGKNRDKLNLYYYNPETKKLETIAKNLKVDNEGYVQFELEHCSDYVLEDKDLEKTESKEETPKTESNNNETPKTETKDNQIPKTGSVVDFNVLFALGIVALASGTILTFKKRKEKTE